MVPRERRGQITSIVKAQVNHLPLGMCRSRPTKGRALGSKSFNAVNTLRLRGRRMRMSTIPNHSSIAMAWKDSMTPGA